MDLRGTSGDRLLNSEILRNIYIICNFIHILVEIKIFRTLNIDSLPKIESFTLFLELPINCPLDKFSESYEVSMPDSPSDRSDKNEHRDAHEKFPDSMARIPITQTQECGTGHVRQGWTQSSASRSARHAQRCASGQTMVRFYG